MNEYLIEVATLDDAKEIYRVMMNVYRKLEDKSIFICSSYDYIKKQIESEGFIVKASDNSGKIVGYYIYRFPGISEDNLGYDLNFEEAELKKVVHSESVVVLPEHRGYGLQKKMMIFSENMIDRNKYKYLLATVAPNNGASKQSYLKNGYSVVMTKEKYNGVLRDILRKDI